jgi:hypothetical protein
MSKWPDRIRRRSGPTRNVVRTTHVGPYQTARTLGTSNAEVMAAPERQPTSELCQPPRQLAHGGRNMSRVKQVSNRKRLTKVAGVPALRAAGLGLSLVGSASASALATADLPQSLSTTSNQRLVLREEEITDVSLATFHVFDKENGPRGFTQVAMGGGGGCGCGGGRGCSCAYRSYGGGSGCRGGGCGHGGCCASWGGCRHC